MAKTSPTRANIAKAKRTTTNPPKNPGTTTRDTNKGIKGNETYKKSREI